MEDRVAEGPRPTEPSREPVLDCLGGITGRPARLPARCGGSRRSPGRRVGGCGLELLEADQAISVPVVSAEPPGCFAERLGVLVAGVLLVVAVVVVAAVLESYGHANVREELDPVARQQVRLVAGKDLGLVARKDLRLVSREQFARLSASSLAVLSESTSQAAPERRSQAKSPSDLARWRSGDGWGFPIQPGLTAWPIASATAWAGRATEALPSDFGSGFSRFGCAGACPSAGPPAQTTIATNAANTVCEMRIANLSASSIGA